MIAHRLRWAAIASASFGTLVFIIWLLPQLLNPTPPDETERKRDERWIDSSPYWLDRQACRWLSLCGIQHLRWDAPALSDHQEGLGLLSLLFSGRGDAKTFVAKEGTSDWEAAPVKPDLKRRRRARSASAPETLDRIPEYVLEHAPLMHLYSGEEFWPSQMPEHLRHMRPFSDGSLLNGTEALSLDNLETLNKEGAFVFLQSHDDVEQRPEWLHSHMGIPEPTRDDGPNHGGHSGGHDEDEGSDDLVTQPKDGTTWWDVDKEHPPRRIVAPKVYNRQKRLFRESQRPLVDTGSPPEQSGYSKAPAILILVDKGSGILDAFWFFFYSYNLGQTVLSIRFGNHVGDWEHCMVRFQHGIPRAMFLSEHAGGKAYTWEALEKRSQGPDKPARPVIYSAVGSHAMYASPGMHPYVLPFKLLKDITDKGPLWDPALNQYAYWYDYEVNREEEAKEPDVDRRTSLVPAASNPELPVSWFHFDGSWGDDLYPLSDERQWRLFGEYHYITGPLGPKFKWLDRRKVCQTEKCTILDSIAAGKKSAWYR